MANGLMFLLNLAWECRYKLPLLITISFMVLDIRMQLEITIESRRVRRIRPIPVNIIENDRNPGPSQIREDAAVEREDDISNSNT